MLNPALDLSFGKNDTLPGEDINDEDVGIAPSNSLHNTPRTQIVPQTQQTPLTQNRTHAHLTPLTQHTQNTPKTQHTPSSLFKPKLISNGPDTDNGCDLSYGKLEHSFAFI